MSELDGANIPQRQPVRTEEGEDLTHEVKAAVDALDTASYVRELDGLVEGHLSLQQTCTVLLHDKQPQETVGRMMEILIQKDEKWLKEEAWNDTRFLFFHYALQHVAGHKLDHDKQAIMEELKTQRFNDSFFDAIAAALPEIVADVERDGEYLRDDLRRARNPVSGEDVLADMGG